MAADGAEQAGIREVAARAGVSYMTVSRVVRGEAPVRPETRERVQRAIEELGYQPSPGARSLRNGRTNTIRLLFDAVHGRFMSNPFQDAVVAGAVDAASRQGYVILIDISRERDKHLPATMAPGDRGPGESERAWRPRTPEFDPRRIDGTIALDALTPSVTLEDIRRSGRPGIVLPNQFADDAASWINADFRDGGLTLVSHLLGLGHRTIGFLSDIDTLVSTRERRGGYHDALRQAGLPIEPDLEEFAGQFRDDGYAATGRLMARRPDLTAIYCVNDLTAFGAIDRLRELGRRVPEDVSVTGYDDIAMAAISNPPLTTIRIPWYEMTVAAVEQIVARIERQIPPTPTTFPVDLIVRGSTAPAPSSQRS